MSQNDSAADQFLSRTVDHRQEVYLAPNSEGVYHTNENCVCLPSEYDTARSAGISRHRKECDRCRGIERGDRPLPDVDVAELHISEHHGRVFHTREQCPRLSDRYDTIDADTDIERVRGFHECTDCREERINRLREKADNPREIDLPADLREVNGGYTVTGPNELRCPEKGCRARCTISHHDPDIEFGHRTGCPRRPDHFPDSGRGISQQPGGVSGD